MSAQGPPSGSSSTRDPVSLRREEKGRGLTCKQVLVNEPHEGEPNGGESVDHRSDDRIAESDDDEQGGVRPECPPLNALHLVLDVVDLARRGTEQDEENIVEDERSDLK